MMSYFREFYLDSHCSENHKSCTLYITGWSKSLCAPDDYSTKNMQTYSIL